MRAHLKVVNHRDEVLVDQIVNDVHVSTEHIQWIAYDMDDSPEVEMRMADLKKVEIWPRSDLL